LGDDFFGNHDDEDGISIPALIAGQQSVVISVDVQDAPVGAFLNAWIDFDQDGVWDAVTEQIAIDWPVVNGLNELVFNVPSSAAAGTTFARFRLSTQAGFGTSGSAPDGEVEDYVLTIDNLPPVLTRSAAQVNGGVLTELLNSGTWSDPESGLVSLTASIGTITKNSDGTWNWSYVAPTKLENEVVTITADDGANQSSVTFEITTDVNVADRKVYYKGSGFAAGGTNIAAALDPSKVLALSGAEPQTLSYANLINTTRGINGMVLDVAGLVTTNLTNDDLVLRMSPQGLFNEAANPPSSWEPAPQSTIFVTAGTATTPARIRLEWPDNAIANRWLQVQLIGNANTGLPNTEVFYLGHLQGELNGQLVAGSYFVSNTDLAMVNPLGGGLTSITDIRDVDKNRFVSNADGIAIRNAIVAGLKLRNITIPAAGSAEEGTAHQGNGTGGIAGGGFDDLHSLVFDGRVTSTWHSTADTEASLATTRRPRLTNKQLMQPTAIVTQGAKAASTELSVLRTASRVFSRASRATQAVDEYFARLEEDVLTTELALSQDQF
jgi:hypothetical protein